MTLVERFGLALPLVQAPMAGVATPRLAAAVCEAGALASIAVGASDADDAAAMIAELSGRTARPFNVNVFTHATPRPDAAREAAWIDALAPQFAGFGAEPPQGLRTIYRSFRDDPAMQALLVDRAPAMVSFHFGLPPPDIVAALRARNVYLVATVTDAAEARAAQAAGMDALVAQGIEAGGHRGMFDPTASDDALGTMALVRILVRLTALPVIAAGGIMDGAGIAAACALGAAAAQLGTAFVACTESGADAAYRAALTGDGAGHTRLTGIISGRPARALPSRFTALGDVLATPAVPDYPIAYDAGKALHAAASARGDHGFAAHWAGQGAPLIRPLPAAELVQTLAAEYAAARG